MPEKVFKKKPLKLKIKERLEDFFYTPYGTLKIFSFFHHIEYYVKYHWIRPRNVVKVKTLKAGYHDIVEVMLHANFAMLVDFVENELIRRGQKEEDHYLDEEKERAEFLNYLEPKGSWKQEDVEKHMAIYVDQNNRTREIFRLYKWWKFERPARKELKMDPETENEYKSVPFSHPVSGSEDEYGEPTLFEWDLTDKVKSHFDLCNKQDRELEAEDQANLNSLINLRNSLWT